MFNSNNAIQIFHTWVLSKIVYSIYDLLIDLGKEEIIISEEDIFKKDNIEKFILQAERFNIIPNDDQLILNIGIKKVIDIIETISIKLKRNRIILLLDDAALTLTPDYMIEFFDIFRSLKTSKISPKASVYPGTTQYGPRFHVGQDAEEVKMWLDVEDDNYSKFMDEFLATRLNLKESIDPDIIEIFKFASFGIPRAFMTLLRTFTNQKNERSQVKYNNVLDIHSNLIRQEYQSLNIKLPQYTSIIETGLILFDKIIDELTKANNRASNHKEVLFGLEEESDTFKYKRMIKLLVEAGLLYEKGSSSEGLINYKRYSPHYLFLIKNRAFSQSRGFNPKEISKILKLKANKRPLRRKYSSLLSNEQLSTIKLDLPPCLNCGTARLTEEQKFCHSCGRPLVGKSSFDSFINIPIEKLPLTEWQKQKILNETEFKTIGDVLQSQNPAFDLRKAKGIGVVKSSSIYNTIRGMVDELLG
ncbi:MAG: zinc ribbon domain-containing protein [Saprospiraceae bacterium]|nr:zinc ribbon domain-containing protein [Saprospiraceae bacterium]